MLFTNSKYLHFQLPKHTHSQISFIKINANTFHIDWKSEVSLFFTCMPPFFFLYYTLNIIGANSINPDNYINPIFSSFFLIFQLLYPFIILAILSFRQHYQ